MPYTPKLLAATVMGSFEKDPADRFPALLDGKDGSLLAEKAMAAAAPEEFVTALVSRTFGGCATTLTKYDAARFAAASKQGGLQRIPFTGVSASPGVADRPRGTDRPRYHRTGHRTSATRFGSAHCMT